MQEDKFSIFIPIEIEKAGDGEDRYANMKFKGVASNPNLGNDKQGQWLDPSGFDFSDFLKSGSINYHHLWKDKPLTIIGEPVNAKITKSNEFFIEGKLYKDSQIARDVYDLAEILEKNSDTRRLGFSIEGKPLAVDPKNKNRILKARISQVAITPAPVCPGTMMELVKGGFDDLQFSNEDNVDFLIDITQDGIRYTVDKNLNIEKAMVAGAITGKETTDQSLTYEPAKKESIEGGRKILKKKKKKQDDDKTLSKGEVFIKLVNDHGLDPDSCKRVYDLAVAIDNS